MAFLPWRVSHRTARSRRLRPGKPPRALILDLSELDQHTAHLSRMYVRSHSRHRGLGRELLIIPAVAMTDQWVKSGAMAELRRVEVSEVEHAPVV